MDVVGRQLDLSPHFRRLLLCAGLVQTANDKQEEEMWGKLAAIAAEQAQSIVGRVDEIASQSLSSASNFLERLDAVGADGTDEDDQEPKDEQATGDIAALDGQTSDLSAVKPVEQSVDVEATEPAAPISEGPSPADPISTSGKGRRKREIKKNEEVVPPPMAAENVLTMEAPAVDTSAAAVPEQAATPPVDNKKALLRIRKLEKEKAQLEEQTNNLQVAVASLSKELQEALQAAAAGQQNSQQAWEIEKEDLLKHIAEQDAKLSADRHRREQVTAQQTRVLTILQEEKAALQQKVLALEHDDQDLLAKHSQLLADHSALSTQHEELMQEHQRIVDSVQQGENDLRLLRAEHADLKAERDTLQERCVAHINDAADLQCRLDEALAALTGAQQDHANLEEQHSTMQAWYEEAKEAKLLMSNLHAALQAEHEAVLAERDGLLAEVRTRSESKEMTVDTADVEDGAIKPGKKGSRRKKPVSLYSTHISSMGSPAANVSATSSIDGSMSTDVSVDDIVMEQSLPVEDNGLQLQVSELRSNLLILTNERDKYKNLYNSILVDNNNLEQQCQDLKQKQRDSDQLSTKYADLLQKYDALAVITPQDQEGNVDTPSKRQQVEQQLAALEMALEQSQGDAEGQSLEEVTSLYNDLSQSYAKLEDDYQTLREEHAQQEEYQQAMRDRITDLEGDYEVVIDKFASLEKDHQALREQNDLLKQQLDDAKCSQADCAAVVNKHDLLDCEHRALQDTHKQLVEQNAQLTLEHVEATGELSALREVHDSLLDECEQFKTTAQIRQADLQQKVGELQAELSGVVQQRDALEAEVSNSLEQRDALQVKIEALENAQTLFRAEIHELKAQRAGQETDLEGKLHQLEQDRADLQQEHEELQSNYSELVRKYGVLKAEQLSVVDQLNEQDILTHQLQGQIQSKDEELESLSAQVEVAQDQAAQAVADWRTKCSELTQSLAEKEQAVLSATSEAGRLKEKLQQTIFAKSNLEMEVNRLNEEKGRLLAQVSALENDLELAIAEVIVVKRYAADIDSQLKSTSDELNSVRAAKDELLTSNQALTADLSALQVKHQEVAAQFSKANLSHGQLLSVESDLASVSAKYSALVTAHDELIAQHAVLSDENNKNKTAVNAFENKKKKDLETLKKQNETISALNNKLNAVAAMEAEHKSLLAKLDGLKATHTDTVSKCNLLQEERDSLLERLSICQVEHDNSVGESSAAAARLVEEIQSLRNQVGMLEEQLKEKEVRLTGLVDELAAAQLATVKAQAALAAVPTQVAIPVAPVAQAMETPKAPAHDDLRATLSRQEVQLADLLAERKDLLSQIDSYQQQLAHYYHNNVYNANSAPMHPTSSAPRSGQHDLEQGVPESDKKDLAGSHPSVIQAWSLFRQHCPGQVVAGLGDRPPRLSLVGQVAVVYGVLLQIAVIYQYSHCSA